MGFQSIIDIGFIVSQIELDYDRQGKLIASNGVRKFSSASFTLRLRSLVKIK